MSALFWTKHRIANTVQALDLDGIPLGTNKIRNDRSKRTAEAIFRASGNRIQGSSFHSVTVIRFRSWAAALLYAGINPDKHIRSAYWSKKKVRDSIVALHNDGFSMFSGYMARDITDGYHKVLKGIVGRNVTGGKLMNAARLHYGSWEKALRQAGIKHTPSPRIRRYPIKTSQTGKWSTSELRIFIRQIASYQTNLKVSSILKFKTDKERFATIVRGQIDPASLHDLAKGHFGTWRNALIQCGLDPNRHMPNGRKKIVRVFPTDSVIQTSFDQDGRKLSVIHFDNKSLSPEEKLIGREAEAKMNRILENAPNKFKLALNRILSTLEQSVETRNLADLMRISCRGFSQDELIGFRKYLKKIPRPSDTEAHR